MEEIRLLDNYNIVMLKCGLINNSQRFSLFYIMSYIRVNYYEEIVNRTKGIDSYEELIDVLYSKEDTLNSDLLNYIKFEIEHLLISYYVFREILEIFINVEEKTITELFKKNVADIFYSDKLKDEYATTEQINELVIDLLDIKENECIYDMCSGLGEFLNKVYQLDKNNYLKGCEINHNSYYLSKIRLSIVGAKHNLEKNDVLETDCNEIYDKLFCNHPWGMRADRYKIEKINSSLRQGKFDWKITPAVSMDWLFVNCMLSKMKKNGKAIAIMPTGPLFKQPDYEIKKILVDKGYIEAIIKLPQRIYSHTVLNPNIIIFSEGNEEVKFIDASNEYTESRRLRILDNKTINELVRKENDKRITILTKKQIADVNYRLTVDYILDESKINYINPRKLGAFIVDRFRGLQITPNEIEELSDPNGEYEILRISDIEDGIIQNNLTRINVENNKYDRYLLKQGDVVITSKSTKIKIAVANIGDRKIIATGNFIVLRLNKETLNPYFLALYLQSSEGTTILKKVQTGQAIISINPSALAEMEISTIDIETQNKAAKKYIQILEEIDMAKKHLTYLQNKYEDLYEKEVVRNVDKSE